MTVGGVVTPRRLVVTAGQRADVTETIALVSGFAFKRLIADRGYAAQALDDGVMTQQIEPVIPPHQRANGQLPNDRMTAGGTANGSW